MATCCGHHNPRPMPERETLSSWRIVTSFHRSTISADDAHLDSAKKTEPRLGLSRSEHCTEVEAPDKWVAIFEDELLARRVVGFAAYLGNHSLIALSSDLACEREARCSGEGIRHALARFPLGGGQRQPGGHAAARRAAVNLPFSEPAYVSIYTVGSEPSSLDEDHAIQMRELLVFQWREGVAFAGGHHEPRECAVDFRQARAPESDTELGKRQYRVISSTIRNIESHGSEIRHPRSRYGLAHSRS